MNCEKDFKNTHLIANIYKVLQFNNVKKPRDFESNILFYLFLNFFYSYFL